MWTPAQLADVLGADDGRCGRRAVRGDRGRARSSTARRRCSCRATPTRRHRAGTDGAGSRLLAAASNPPAARRATTRSSRRGTGWRSRRWPRPAVLLDEPALPRGGRTARRTAARRARGRRAAAPDLARRPRRRIALAVAEDYGDARRGSAGAAPGHRPTRAGCSAAGELLDFALASTSPTDRGGFFDTGDDAEQLVRRPQDPTDNAAPSGASALVGALVGVLRADRVARAPRVGRGGAGARSVASGRAIRASWAGRSPAAEALVAGPVQVAVVGEPAGGPLVTRADADGLVAGGRRARVVVSGRPDAARGAAAGRPAAGRRPPGGLRVPGDGLRPAGHRRRGAVRGAGGHWAERYVPGLKTSVA